MKKHHIFLNFLKIFLFLEIIYFILSSFELHFIFIFPAFLITLMYCCGDYPHPQILLITTHLQLLFMSFFIYALFYKLTDILKYLFISLIIIITIICFGLLTFKTDKSNQKINYSDNNCNFPNLKNIDFFTLEQTQTLNCNSNNQCQWQSVGGESTEYFACCPINLEPSTDSQTKFRRCFTAID